jgi:hypothetical protein
MCLYRVPEGSKVSVSTKTTWATIKLDKDLLLDSKNIANTLPELGETVFHYKKSIYFIKNADLVVV